MERKKAKIVKLQENLDKILFAISYVIKTANEKGITPSQYQIVKTIFLADRRHLNEWGRPITFDNYVAMKHGPVPSLVYNVLCETAVAAKRFKHQDFPWTREQVSHSEFHYSDVRHLDYDQNLSPSDKEELEAAFNIISKLDFGQIRKLTHEDPAYLDAWEDVSRRKQFPMSLALLFESPNFKEAERVAEQSKYA